LVTPEPRTPMQPALWRYAELREHVMHAGELITAEEAERRVLILENPATPGQSRITSSLYAGLQLILPGEVAPCHRHTQSALRFVMEGEGAFTALCGRRARMSQWDLILTPNWLWHDHGNETDQPVLWLDGLDIPLVQSLDASFAEHRQSIYARANDVQISAGPGQARYRRAPAFGTQPSEERNFIYPYAEWRAALADLACNGPLDEGDGYRLEFINPEDGGPIMRTMSAFCQLVPQGCSTQAVQTTDGSVFVVVEGTGSARIGASSFPLMVGDIFVVPSWVPRSFEAAHDLVLFSYSDKAAQEKLGLWRRGLG
jgi:gentisate 1,2-dioxygenase